MELPAEDSAPKKSEAPKETKESPKKDDTAVPQEERTSAPPQASKSSGKATKQTYPLYPSVQHLLEVNGLTKDDADKIPATGPSGRLLKGDVLAYVGKIEDSYPSELQSRFEKLAKLDLSNIKPAAKKEAPKKAAAVEEAVAKEVDVEVALPISLTAVLECQKRVKDSIGVFLPLSTFVARAAELANEDLPKSKLAKPTADELFNAVLGFDKVAAKYSRGSFVPEVTALPPMTLQSTRTPAKKSDVLDILAGKKPQSRKASVGGAERVVGPLNVFSISVPKGDEQRGRVFLERVKSVLEVEPGRLVI